MNDIAGGRTVLGTFTPVQLFAGEAPITTNDYVLTTNCTKYQVCTVAADGTVKAAALVADIVGKNIVIASQAGASGDRIAFFDGGNFNHEALTWPSDAAATFDGRRALVDSGNTLKIGRLVN